MNAAETAQGAAAAQPLKNRTGSGARIYSVECFALAWIAGLLLAFFGMTAAAVCAAVLPLSAALLRRLASFRRCLLAGSAGLLLAAGVWTVYDCTVRKPLLRADGTSAVCTGTVTDTAMLTGARMRYTLRTEIAGVATSADWYASADMPPLQIGDRVTLRADLTRIAPDYRYHTDRVQAGQGRYLRIYSAELLSETPGSKYAPLRLAAAYREYITGLITSRLDTGEAGLLCAMLFGDKQALADGDADTLYRTGIGHITAVSGLHLVFFCALIAWLLQRLTASPRTVFLCSLLGMGVFILLVDSSVSVYRAAVMVTLHRAAPLIGRKTDPLRSLCIAMFLCTCFTPYVIGSASFWLSASGVFGIAVAAPYLIRQTKAGPVQADAVRLITVSAAVFPASLLLTGESSLLGPVCNLLILPFGTAALYLGLIVVITGGLGTFLLPVAGLLCRLMLAAAESASLVPFACVRSSAVSVRVTLVLCTLLMLVLFACKSPPKRIVTAFVLSALLLTGQGIADSLIQRSRLRVAVLGQKNEAALVITSGGQTVVADLTDAVRSPGYVRQFLRESGISQVDILLLSGPRSAAAYQQALADTEVCRVILYDAGPGLGFSQLCGTVPEFAAEAEQEIAADSYTLRYSGSTVEISYHGITVAAVPADNPDPVAADAVIRYGRSYAGTTDYCAPDMQIIPADTGNNLLLTVSGNRTARVDALT